MLREWLGDMSVDEFFRTCLGKRPFAQAGSARAALGWCDWTALDRILRAEPGPDVLVVARGELSDQPVPRSRVQLEQLFGGGVGIVVRHAQRQHEPLSALCRAFSEELPGEQRLLVFATPRGVHGFGWHYDPEEVFIVQTAGTKQYYLRANTLVSDPRPGAQPDFSVIRRETTPLMSCTLQAGDWLYVPRGMWHVASPLEDSLSISLGVIPRTSRGRSRAYPATATRSIAT